MRSFVDIYDFYLIFPLRQSCLYLGAILQLCFAGEAKARRAPLQQDARRKGEAHTEMGSHS